MAAFKRHFLAMAQAVYCDAAWLINFLIKLEKVERQGHNADGALQLIFSHR